MDLVDLVDLVDLKKRWIWTFAPNPPPRLYKTRKVDLDSVTEKLAKTLEVDLVDLDFKFAKTSKVDLKGFEHRCDIWRSRWEGYHFSCVCVRRPSVRRPSSVRSIFGPLLSSSDGITKYKTIKNRSEKGSDGTILSQFLRIGSRLEILPNRYISSLS